MIFCAERCRNCTQVHENGGVGGSKESVEFYGIVGYIISFYDTAFTSIFYHNLFLSWDGYREGKWLENIEMILLCGWLGDELDLMDLRGFIGFDVDGFSCGFVEICFRLD